MKRLAIAAVALATLAGPLAAPASAQTKMDCSRLYKDFWEKMDREKFAKISAEQLAGVSRLALRAYDACLTAAIEAWQRRLAPLGDLGPDTAPPPHLFECILSRIPGSGEEAHTAQ